MTMCKLSFLIPGSVVLGSVGSTRAQAVLKASLGPRGYGMAYTGSVQVQHQAWGNTVGWKSGESLKRKT